MVSSRFLISWLARSSRAFRSSAKVCWSRISSLVRRVRLLFSSVRLACSSCARWLSTASESFSFCRSASAVDLKSARLFFRLE